MKVNITQDKLTVKDLKKILDSFNDNDEIFVYDTSTDNGFFVKNISSDFIKNRVTLIGR